MTRIAGRSIVDEGETSDRTARGPWTGRWLLAGLIGLAILWRLPSLLYDGLWRDDANVYAQVIAPTFGEFMHRVTLSEWHPPLFFVIAYLWTRVAGTSELAFKIVPFIFSVLTVAAVYALGSTASGPRTGRIAAGMYAIAPPSVTYSSEYVYPLIAFLCTLLAWLVMRARRDAPPLWVFAAISAVTLFTVYTHYSALLYLPLLCFWALTGRNGIRIAGAIILGAVPFAFWLPVFLQQRTIGMPFASQTTVAGKGMFFGASLADSMPVATLVLQAIFAMLLVAAIARLARSSGLNADALALGLIFVAALFLTATQNLLQLRYVLHLYGLFCVFIAAVLVKFVLLSTTRCPRNVQARRLAMVAVFATCICAVDAAYAYRVGLLPKSGIRTLAASQGFDQRTLYLVAPDYLASTFAFYARDSGVTFHGFVRWERPEVLRIAGYASDWRMPRALEDTLSAIASEEHHFRCLDVIADEYARNQGDVHYGRVSQLLNRLEQRYPLVRRAQFAGRHEAISVYRFSLTETANHRKEAPATATSPSWRRCPTRYFRAGRAERQARTCTSPLP